MFLLIFLTAVVAGAFGSMLGIGGALILVPVITLFLDVPMKVAIGASIIGVIATSSAAQIVYVDHGITHTRLGMALELATTVGAIGGALTAAMVDVRVLQLLFAIMLFWAAWSMRGRRAARRPSIPTGVLDDQFLDPATQTVVRYGVRHLPLGLGLSLLAGNVSGLLGVGGGAVKMPVMHVIMGVPLRAAIATSNFMIGVTAATSAAVYIGKGFVDPLIAVPTALGVLLGAQGGARLASRLPTRVLRTLMVLTLTVFAIQMLWRTVA